MSNMLRLKYFVELRKVLIDQLHVKHSSHKLPKIIKHLFRIEALSGLRMV